MKRFSFALFLVLLVSICGYSQNCKNEDKERAKSLVQKLEPDNTLRFYIENNSFGDCIHYAWMDEMRKLGIKQVAATLGFVWNDKFESLEITNISFLQTYYRYDTEVKDKELLEQIENSALKKQLEEAIWERAKNRVLVLIAGVKENYKKGLLKKNPKGKISGTIYEVLLDDEALPIWVGIPKIDF